MASVRPGPVQTRGCATHSLKLLEISVLGMQALRLPLWFLLWLKLLLEKIKSQDTTSSFPPPVSDIAEFKKKGF